MSAAVTGQPGWRWLGLFWAAFLVLAGSGLVTLQVLGPLPALPSPVAREPIAAVAPAAEAPNRSVAEPVASMLERSTLFAPAMLPRVGPQGQVSRVVYAAPSAPAPVGMARVALLISGFGLADRDSQAAIALPAAVSLAVSSYAPPSALVAAAREAGHEVLASVPMEPQGYPLNDEGTRSLRTGLSQEENRANLEWALSRTQGVVGATGASDGMRGERFADIPAVFDQVVEEVVRRGLLYVDARPGRVSPPGQPVRAVDVVLDDQLGRAEVDSRLLALERVAKEKGLAIGLAGSLRPATIERIAAWSKTLQERGLVLVPVSALVTP